MPRANRYFLPGHVWHITHRCHQKEFLLKFALDRFPENPRSHFQGDGVTAGQGDSRELNQSAIGLSSGESISLEFSRRANKWTSVGQDLAWIGDIEVW